MKTYQEIHYEVDSPSAIITLNRPEALNALTNNMMAVSYTHLRAHET